MVESYKIINNKVILRMKGKMYDTPEELLGGNLFRDIIQRAIEEIKQKSSILINIFHNQSPDKDEIQLFIDVLLKLTKNRADEVQKLYPESKHFFASTALLRDVVEYMYNFWRSFERYVLCDQFQGSQIDKRPYRTFNDTVGTFSHLMRQIYRDIVENITGSHPRVYRQVEAGAEFGTISIPVDVPFPDQNYRVLNSVRVMRQVLLNPPLILEPTMNKRTGRFIKIEKNPLAAVSINPDEWLCYPAKVGDLVIHVYFHEKFFELGFTLCNLFELADDDQLVKPDAVYLFGVPGHALDDIAEYPTVFYDDAENDLLVAACPNGDEYGYFGYLKKMVLTLHNIKIMKQKKMPFHGALVNIHLKNGKESTVLLIGDSGAGKSETLEALRNIGAGIISDIIIIADDMGSLEIDRHGHIIGYGTETGAFLRIDDLKPGYAFGQIDRSIIMSAGRPNARIVLPVTSYDNVIKGFTIDIVLYANNYDEIDGDHSILEKIDTPERALSIFKEGTVMSKGTTTSTGLVHSYFANIFGPPQYRELHDEIAEKYFKAFYACGCHVGQLRTRLGIAGHEMTGPEESAKELLKLIGA